MRAWRISRERFADTAFSGFGAREYGGRWNSPGRGVVYLSGTIALAALEMLVHAGDRAELLQDFVFIEVEFDEGLVQVLDQEALPEDWSAYPEPEATKRLGDRWFDDQASLLLAVPSAVIPQEMNLLLNPLHPDFGKVKRGAPQSFHFDTRLR